MSSAPGAVFRRPSLRIIIVALACLALGILWWAWHVPAPHISPIPYTNVNPYGANFFLEREVEAWKRERTVALAQRAGIGWARQQFLWSEIEPRKGEFQWGKYDGIVGLYERYGLRVIARLDRAPAWARPPRTLPEHPPARFEDYGDFVVAFARRYRGRVRYIQVWNEPNIFPEWGNRPVDPAGYVELLKVAYTRAKAADPDVVVLSAPLAPTVGEQHPEPGQWTAMNEVDYLEGMYAAGARGYFDILSANGFGFDRPPTDPPDPQVLNFRRVLLQRQVMERHGDGRKPIWFNEYGWNAAPAAFAEESLIWKRVTEAQQADYTVWGIEQARREWPWAGVFNIWYFRQVGDIPPDRADYYFRTVDPDFTLRPLYYAVAHAAAQTQDDRR